MLFFFRKVQGKMSDWRKGYQEHLKRMAAIQRVSNPLREGFKSTRGRNKYAKAETHFSRGQYAGDVKVIGPSDKKGYYWVEITAKDGSVRNADVPANTLYQKAYGSDGYGVKGSRYSGFGKKGRGHGPNFLSKKGKTRSFGKGKSATFLKNLGSSPKEAMARLAQLRKGKSAERLQAFAPYLSANSRRTKIRMGSKAKGDQRTVTRDLAEIMARFQASIGSASTGRKPKRASEATVKQAAKDPEALQAGIETQRALQDAGVPAKAAQAAAGEVATAVAKAPKAERRRVRKEATAEIKQNASKVAEVAAIEPSLAVSAAVEVGKKAGRGRKKGGKNRAASNIASNLKGQFSRAQVGTKRYADLSRRLRRLGVSEVGDLKLSDFPVTAKGRRGRAPGSGFPGKAPSAKVANLREELKAVKAELEFCKASMKDSLNAGRRGAPVLSKEALDAAAAALDSSPESLRSRLALAEAGLPKVENPFRRRGLRY